MNNWLLWQFAHFFTTPKKEKIVTLCVKIEIQTPMGEEFSQEKWWDSCLAGNNQKKFSKKRVKILV